jgi:hypothetical protein
MEAIFSSETFFEFQQTTRHYIPEDTNLKILYPYKQKTQLHGLVFYSLFLVPQYVNTRISIHGASNCNISLLHSGDLRVRISDGTLIILTDNFSSVS